MKPTEIKDHFLKGGQLAIQRLLDRKKRDHGYVVVSQNGKVITLAASDVPHPNPQALKGNRVIELKTAGVDKGTAAARLLDELRPDFVLAFGDDRTDEDTFRALPWSAWMVKVGEASTSRARFSVS